MAVRDWHPGQLVIAWLAALLSLPAAYLIGVVVGGVLGVDVLAGVLVLAVPLCAFSWMLIVSWRWFGSRNSKEVSRQDR
jgi:hypothetical protein